MAGNYFAKIEFIKNYNLLKINYPQNQIVISQGLSDSKFNHINDMPYKINALTVAFNIFGWN